MDTLSEITHSLRDSRHRPNGWIDFFSLMGELEMGALEDEATWHEEVIGLVGVSTFLVKEGSMVDISKLAL